MDQTSVAAGGTTVSGYAQNKGVRAVLNLDQGATSRRLSHKTVTIDWQNSRISPTEATHLSCV